MSNPIPYRIVEIIVNGFNVQSDENLDKNIEINVSTEFSYAVNIPAHRVRCISKYIYTQEEKEVLSCDLTCTFEVKEEAFNSFIKDDKLTLDVDWLIYMATIAVGAARGEIHARAEIEKSDLSEVILPPINLVEIIKESAIFPVVKPEKN